MRARLTALVAMVVLLSACSSQTSPAPSPGAPTTKSLSASCSDAIPYVKQALDVGYGGEAQDASTATSWALTLRQIATQAPDLLASDLVSLANNLDRYSAGTTVKSRDLTVPGEGIYSTCGETYDDDGAEDTSSEPAATPTHESSGPKLTRAERRYLSERVYSESGDDDYADEVASELKTGRTVCSRIGDRSPGFSRSRYLYDRELNADDADDAVTYLCPTYASDLKLSHRTIDEDSNNDVGDDVEAGTYRSASGVNDCYWERQTGGGSIIANDFVTHATNGVTVTIRPSDSGFTTRGCGPLYPTAKP